MKHCEYTPERAQALTKLHIPEFDSQLNIKILWFDVLNSTEISADHPCALAHTHSFFELIFALSGEITYKYGDTHSLLNRNKALFVPPLTPHRFYSCSENAIKLSIAFSLGDNISELPDITEISVSPAALENINYILKNCENKNFLFPGIIGGRIFEILYLSLASLNLNLPETDDKKIDSRVLVAKDFVNSNKGSLITCDDVAKECCLSSKQLNRIFKSYMGTSLFEYIVDSKIKYAKHLLSSSDKSIKEISFMLGFENESSFISFFKRHTALTPGSFRKESPKMSVN